MLYGNENAQPLREWIGGPARISILRRRAVHQRSHEPPPRPRCVSTHAPQHESARWPHGSSLGKADVMPVGSPECTRTVPAAGTGSVWKVLTRARQTKETRLAHASPTWTPFSASSFPANNGIFSEGRQGSERRAHAPSRGRIPLIFVSYDAEPRRARYAVRCIDALHPLHQL